MAQPPQMPKTFTAPELLALELPESRQIVPGILNEGATLISARPKKGKTFLALGCGLAVAIGGFVLGKIEVEQGDVLYLGLEDGPRRLRDRLRAMLGGSSAPERLTLATEWPRIDEGGIDFIKQWLRRANNPRMVVIDTLQRMRPREHGNKRLYTVDYESCAPLNDLAHQGRISIPIIHHNRKADSEDHIDNPSGTLGLTGAVDAVITLTRARGEADARLLISGRDCEDSELALKWDGALSQWSLLGDAAIYTKSPERRQIIELLSKSGPFTPTEVSTLLSREYSATKKLLWSMAQDGEVKSIDGHYIISTTNNGNHGNPVTVQGYQVTTVTDGDSGGWITDEMRQRLRACGETDTEINAMRSREAQALLEYYEFGSAEVVSG